MSKFDGQDWREPTPREIREALLVDRLAEDTDEIVLERNLQMLGAILRKKIGRRPVSYFLRAI